VFNNPGTPNRNGYTFIEWRLNGVKYNFATPVTGNITLVAEYSINEPGNYKLTLPSGVTSDAVNPNSIPAGTDITLTVSEVAGKDVVVFVNGVYRKQDTAGLIEVEVLSNVTVETRLVDKTTPLFDIRKLSDVEVNFMGIITGIIPDGNGNYIYVNDETAAIIYYSAISPQLKVGDLLHVKGGFVTTLYNNKVIYPQAQGIETILKSNQPLPPAVYAQDVSHGTLDYQGLSLQAQRFNIENLTVVEKPLEGKSKNFLVEDQYGNQVQIRVHKYLTDPVYNEIWNVLKDLQLGDQISLEGAHLGQYQKSGQPTYIIQFMLSSAQEIIPGAQGVRHQVTFKLGTGEPDASVNVVDGKTILQSSVPMVFRAGYKFIGWYEGVHLFDFNTPIIGPITLTAKWEVSQDPVDPTDPSNPNNQAVINNQNDPKVIAYYQGINFQSSASALQQALKSLVSVNAALGYDSAKSWLLDADRDLVNTNKLRGIYDQALFNRAWDSAATWNREHVWPQSKLRSAPKGEAHNLRVSGTRINSSRGNYPFGENSSSTGNLGCRIGSKWWPGNIDKGDVARITMFMNLRYGLRVTNNADIKVLYKWHIEDPVDAFEIQRNNVIHSKQGNRNPFIDHPEIFAKLYELVGGQIASAKADTEIFLQTNISYSVIMTNINIGDLNRKQLVI
jgi:endonuclease I